jgi:hypothetical protein
MGKPLVSDVVRTYVALRDKKNEIKRRHSEELAPLNEKMEKIEGWLQRNLMEQGLQSQRTENGTAYLSTDTKATVKDRDAFFEWVIKNERWDFLESRVSKSVVRDYLEETGEIVPGINYEATQVVRIRR